MCLIVVAWRVHPSIDLIVIANRDEFHARPTQQADWWPDAPQVLGGRDLQAGGTWLAVSKSGRFSTVTNYREQSFTRSDDKSRGELVTSFVTGDSTPDSFAAGIDADDYAGFNLLSADRSSIGYVSNRGDSQISLAPGVYGLSNAALDTPWSKLTRSKEKLTGLINADNVNETSMLRILHDRETAIEDVNSEHLSLDQARAITAPFIVTETYGTRCSTVLLRHASGTTEFTEQRFDAAGQLTGVSEFSF